MKEGGPEEPAVMQEEGTGSLLDPGSERAGVCPACSFLNKEGHTVPCIPLHWGVSQLMSWSQRKTVTHTRKVIHEKNSQESPSSLQILSFSKCQEPTAVLLVLLGPLLLAEA